MPQTTINKAINDYVRFGRWWTFWAYYV